jgi:soluble lytic murein transglycosylase
LPAPAGFLHEIGLDDDAETQLRERENLVATAARGRSTEALCHAYGLLGRGKRRYQVAQQIPNALLFASPEPSNRWAWECAFPSPYNDDVRAAEAKEGLPPGLVHAVMRQESAFDPDALSSAHAMGLLQLVPETGRTVAASLGIPEKDLALHQPRQNIRLGAHFLKNLMERFRAKLPYAIAAYNAGADAVTKWQRRHPDRELDLFVETIPYGETRNYVIRVMGNYARYAYLNDGETAVPRLSLAP